MQTTPRRTIQPVCNFISLHSGFTRDPFSRGQKRLLDNLHLGLDDERVRDREAIPNLGPFHELLPSPVMLFLAEPMQRIWTQKTIKLGRGARAKGHGFEQGATSSPL